MYDVSVCLCVTISLFDASLLDGLLLPLGPGPRLHGPGPREQSKSVINSDIPLHTSKTIECRPGALACVHVLIRSLEVAGVSWLSPPSSSPSSASKSLQISS